MARIRYEDWKPQGDSIAIVATANAIAAEYAAQGYDLTLRQLYYQFVARDLLPNTQKSYDRLGQLVNRARMAGLMDWGYLVDRTRNIRRLANWNDPSEIIDTASKQYRVDRWSNQRTRIEVWVEKEALAGVVQRVAERNDVAWFSCRGYVSQSEMWGAAQRLMTHIEAGQNVVILHLGDHDPSGIDMTRDIRERLSTFLTQDWLNAHPDHFDGDTVKVSDIWHDMGVTAGATPFVVDRIALNFDQIEEYGPPPNPAKMTDSRANDYVARFGDESWELDALDPATLDALIESTLNEYIDDDAWEEREELESTHRDLLTRASEAWPAVADILSSL